MYKRLILSGVFIFLFITLYIYYSGKSIDKNKNIDIKENENTHSYWEKDTVTRDNKNEEAKPVHFSIFQNADGSYGYDIYIEEKRIISQPVIPGLMGNKGFLNKAEAEKVAAVVVQKIIHNEMPPSISKEELEKLGIKE